MGAATLPVHPPIPEFPTSPPTRVQDQPGEPVAFPRLADVTAAIFAALSVPFVAAVLATEIRQSGLSLLVAVGIAAAGLATLALLGRVVSRERPGLTPAEADVAAAPGAGSAVAVMCSTEPARSSR